MATGAAAQGVCCAAGPGGTADGAAGVFGDPTKAPRCIRCSDCRARRVGHGLRARPDSAAHEGAQHEPPTRDLP